MQLVRPSLLQARNGRLVPDLGVPGIDAAPNSYGGSNVIAGSGQSVATAFCWTPERPGLGTDRHPALGAAGFARHVATQVTATERTDRFVSSRIGEQLALPSVSEP